VHVIVEYATIVSALSLLAAALTGAYGQNVAAVFSSGSVGVAAVAKAARSQDVPVAGAKKAYRTAPYGKPALRFLYAAGWIGGMRNRGQCALTSITQDAARKHTEREIRRNGALLRELRKRAIPARVAAAAVVKGVVSACP
jgi:hypothetical protein